MFSTKRRSWCSLLLSVPLFSEPNEHSAITVAAPPPLPAIGGQAPYVLPVLTMGHTVISTYLILKIIPGDVPYLSYLRFIDEETETKVR